MEEPANNIINVTADGFISDVIEASQHKPVVVDFWADWSEPCKSLMPMLEQLAEKYPEDFILAKINADEEQSLAMQIGIQSLPTVALVKGGEIVDSFSGLKSAAELEKWLLPYLDNASTPDDEPVVVENDEVTRLMAEQSYEAALALLKDMPEDEAIWQTMEIHLLMGDVDQAEKLLNDMAEELRKQPQADQIAARIQLEQIDLESREDLKAIKTLINQGATDEAAEQLLEKLGDNPQDDAVKQLLIQSFVLNEDRTQVNRYRRRMSSLLF